MFRRIILIAALFQLAEFVHSQEIKATVQVIAPRIQVTNKQVFTTLQNAIQQFINNRKWTEEKLEAREKIEVSFFMEITGYQNEKDMMGTLQVTSTRPIFNSGYKSNIFQFNDEDISFSYRELDALDFQENQSVNDLTSILAYYCYIVLGHDFDSYGELGGTSYFSKAQNIVNLNTGKAGWNQSDGKGQRNRFYIAENMNNIRFQPFRKLNYAYHRNGLDKMYENTEDARIAITNGLKSIQDLVAVLPNSATHRIWFSTKLNEIVEIYKGATIPEKTNIITLLTKLDPVNRQKWEKIRE